MTGPTRTLAPSIMRRKSLSTHQISSHGRADPFQSERSIHPSFLQSLVARHLLDNTMENSKRYDNPTAPVVGTQAHTVVNAILKLQMQSRITGVESDKKQRTDVHRREGETS